MARHWRGSLSLGISFWVNNVLVGAAIGALAGGVGAFASNYEWADPRPWMVFTILIFAFGFVVFIWQFVGTWRSAVHHIEKTRRVFWARAAQVFLILGCVLTSINLGLTAPMFVEMANILLKTDELQAHRIYPAEDETVLVIDGYLPLDIDDEVRGALALYPNVRTVRLNSLGGRLAAARALRDLILERDLNTSTTTICQSACAVAFMAGVERTLHSGAVIGFHRYSFPGMPETDIRREEARDADWFRRAGIDPDFVDKAFTAAADDIWMPTPDELRDAGVITAVIRLSPATMSRVEEEALASNALLQAIKKYEPDQYRKLMDEFLDSASSIDSPVALARMKERFVPYILGRMPYASDRAIVDFAGVLVEQLRHLSAKDPNLCVRLLLPQHFGPLNVVAHLPPDLIAAELGVLAEVVRTASEERETMPEAAEVENELEKIMATLLANHGATTITAMAYPAATSVEDRELCAVFIDLYERILELGDPRRGKLLRHIFASVQ